MQPGAPCSGGRLVTLTSCCLQGVVTRCPLKLILRRGAAAPIKLYYKEPGADPKEEAAWVHEELDAAGVDAGVRRATEVGGMQLRGRFCISPSAAQL